LNIAADRRYRAIALVTVTMTPGGPGVFPITIPVAPPTVSESAWRGPGLSGTARKIARTLSSPCMGPDQSAARLAIRNCSTLSVELVGRVRAIECFDRNLVGAINESHQLRVLSSHLC
jgi:hypothetical protein